MVRTNTGARLGADFRGNALRHAPPQSELLHADSMTDMVKHAADLPFLPFCEDNLQPGTLPM